VYDFLEPERNAELDESSTLELHPLDRDEYAQVKLLQEQLVRAFPGDVTIIRPGLVYGPGAWWNAGRALRLAGRYWLTIAPSAAMKLTHVRNCADAIALAVEQPAAIGATFNIVDDDLPSQRQYERMLRDAGLDHDRSIPMPFAVASFGATLLLRINRRLFRGRAKLPGIAVPAKQAARFKPLRYQHDAATRVLGWKPQISLVDAVAAEEKAVHDE
jgi:nucleoside-diphosphate-sugar epimerase